MVAKYGAVRRRAFLTALAQTGNQTLAAERAKVSLSWVRLHRAGDPEFRRAVDESLEQARERLDAHETRKPPSGWGFLDGEELVVKGTAGSALPRAGRDRSRARRVQIARAQPRQWSPRVEARFLATLGATCNVKAACGEVGLTPSSAYRHRRRWPGFAGRWDAALEEGHLRLEIGLLEHGANVFSGTLGDFDDVSAAIARASPMSVEQALMLLDMRRRRAASDQAFGKRWRRPPSLDDPGMRESIIRRFETMLAGWDMDPPERAHDEAEWKRRRSG